MLVSAGLALLNGSAEVVRVPPNALLLSVRLLRTLVSQQLRVIQMLFYLMNAFHGFFAHLLIRCFLVYASLEVLHEIHLSLLRRHFHQHY